jgi:hypothetical protein
MFSQALAAYCRHGNIVALSGANALGQQRLGGRRSIIHRKQIVRGCVPFERLATGQTVDLHVDRYIAYAHLDILDWRPNLARWSVSKTGGTSVYIGAHAA